MSSRHYNIDVVGGCNLRCPSCPVGNSADVERPSGFMTEELFRQIIEKIRRESPDVTRVYLYNWTEPTLHPYLARLIEVADACGIKCSLSSNLNLCRNMEEVIAAGPKTIRVSISGFSQEQYGRTHRKGDVAKVKTNMRLLRETIDRLGAETKVHILYHCYIDNCGKELQKVRALCRELAFGFQAVWAYLMPIEKHLAYLEGGPLDGDDQALIDLLAIKPEEARDIALAEPSADCNLRANQTTISCDGSVLLCCSVYDAKYTIAKSFLDTPFDEIKEAMYKHPYCHECMAQGCHDSMKYTGMAEWNRIGKKRIVPDLLPEGLIPKVPGVTKRVKKGVRKVLKSMKGILHAENAG